MIVLAIGNAGDEHVGRYLDDGTNRPMSTYDIGDLLMRHAILETDDQTIGSEARLDQLTCPFRVISFDDQENQIEWLLDLRYLAQVQRRDSNIYRTRRQINRDAVATNCFDVFRPL